jgi:DNA-binding NtrC family response regulator
VLINYFSGKFCQQCQKELGGYSVAAFEALQGYDWKGNVRQLENEINSIINLKEDNETISIEMLSDDIKSNYLQEDNLVMQPGEKTTDNQEEFIIQYLKKGKESEKEILLQLLKRNKWNVSQTARDLNITYQGLHKKLKKMKIERPSYE